MKTPANVALRFAFVAFSTLGGAVLTALLTMFLTASVYQSANGHAVNPNDLNAGLFVFLIGACAVGTSLGASAGLVLASIALYLSNKRAEAKQQQAA
jgi:multisubunit Na+/H+ antiporter MnhB subunit